MWLHFFLGGISKVYAETLEGEFAFSDSQGLYEWHHRGPGGELTRTQYTGGDRQISSDGAMWIAGPVTRPEGWVSPAMLGFRYAVAQYTTPTS